MTSLVEDSLPFPTDKVLPPLPPPTLRNIPDISSGLLNVAAREHRGRLIRHFISELVPLPSNSDYSDEEAGNEAWAFAIESALDELGQSIKRGQWLTGVLKRRRKMTETPQAESDTLHIKSTSTSSAIATLRSVASIARPPDPSKAREPKHIVLCLAPSTSEDPQSKAVLPKQDLGFDIISDVVRRPMCSFRVGVFVLPNNDEDAESEETQGCVLYGLKEWEEWCDVFPALPLPLLAGGTFTIQNAVSSVQRKAISSVLRLAIYVHLSLTLEQHLLADFNVKLEYAPPPPLSTTPTPSNLTSPTTTPNAEPASIRSHKSVGSVGNIKQGLFNFLSRNKPLHKFGGGLPRILTGSPTPPSSAPAVGSTSYQPRLGGSLDLTRTSSLRIGKQREPSNVSSDGAVTPTPSRLRRFSFMSHAERPSLLSSSGQTATTTPSQTSQGTKAGQQHLSMVALLEKLEKEKSLLSSSTGVVIPPPPLVVDLAAKEKSELGGDSNSVSAFSQSTASTSNTDISGGKQRRRRRLKADERMGLNALLGWDVKHEPSSVDITSGGTLKTNDVSPHIGRSRKGAGMTGVGAFVRQQGLEVIFSRHVPLLEPTSSPSDRAQKRASTSTTGSSTSTADEGAADTKEDESSELTCTPCGRPIPISFRYFGESSDEYVSEETQEAGEVEDRTLRDVVMGLIQESGKDCAGHCEVFEPRDQESALKKRRRSRNHTVEGSEGGNSVTGTVGTSGGESIQAPAPSAAPLSSSLTSVVDDDARSLAATSIASTKDKEKEKKEAKPAIKKELKVKCTAKQGEHEMRLVHGQTRVTIDIVGWDRQQQGEKDESKDPQRLSIWSSCAICGKDSERKSLSDGASLYSFSKFVELLVYSPFLDHLDEGLCEHVSSTTDQTIPSSSKYNIVRNIKQDSSDITVTFKLSKVSKVFELRVPRLQVDTTNAGAKLDLNLDKANVVLGINTGDDKKILRREIKKWWEGLSDHLDKLEEAIVSDEASEDHAQFRKALPRLPSVYDDDSYDDAQSSEDIETPRPSIAVLPASPQNASSDHISGLPPSSRPGSPKLHGYLEKLKVHSPLSFSGNDYFSRGKIKAPIKDGMPPSPETPMPRSVPRPVLPHKPASSPATPSPSDPAFNTSDVTPKPLPSKPKVEDSARLLSSLRENFQKTEQNLYSQLSKTTESNLNEARRAFAAAAKGAEKRLVVWQTKHLPGASSLPGKLQTQEPEWFAAGCHALPGGNIIVREDDWGSIIAYTMSTPEYQRELAGMSMTRLPSSSPLSPAPHDLSPASTTAPSGSSFFSSASQYKLFSFGSDKQPDPDSDDVVWHEPEQYSAVVSRKEHPRDPTSLLSIREVLRQKSPSEASALSSLNSRFGTRSSSASLAPPSLAPPPSAWSKPDVQVSKEAAGGEVSGLPESSKTTAGKKLQEIEAVAEPYSRPSSAMSGSFADSSISSLKFEAHIKRKNSSIFSMDSDKTTGPGEEDPAGSSLRLSIPSRSETPPPNLAINVPSDSKDPSPVSQRSGSVLSNTLTAGLTNAMRFVLTGSADPGRSPSPLAKTHHGLLSAESLSIDERPHIKYDWTIGKRLKFSCTVYYAKQFDSLRKRCGIDDMFLRSIATSSNWAADGGKSKSNFWKTADDRFIIKTLVNAWNVADLQVLIELGPSYFKYLESTATKPSVLAKLMGFYTVEIRNLETGNVQAKADLLIMENLFYQQSISRSFDLKGIQGRKVKTQSASKGKTLFDGEWIEGQQQSLTFIQPHSKHVLREALKSDADFLARSNIMDYSLLLGIDDQKKQMSCGLVDTIGSYTFAKTLEYKAKQGLSAGSKEVTVIPPTEYQERFVNALEGYFVPCPDKWTKPTTLSKVVTDMKRLPSVL